MLLPSDTLLGNHQRYCCRVLLKSWKTSYERERRGDFNVIDSNYWLFILDGWLKRPAIMEAASAGSE